MPRRDDDYDDDYEDDRRERRSDEIAHRGGLILAFGIMSIMMFFFCGLLGLPLGILAWIWGVKDLCAMDAGEMDPEGRGMTQGGMITGIIGTIIGGLTALAVLIYLVVVVFIIGVAAAGK